MITELTPIYCEYIPGTLVSGFIYISKKYNIAIHLCACGCEGQTVTPLGQNEWTLTKNQNNEITLRPSIGNFSGEIPYHCHYYITNNKIEILN